jgi:glycosyltransferase involved in cell wall biosynthesis
MKIALVSDAWLPQVNGVVRTLQNTRDELIAMGHQVTVIGPDRFRTVPCPSYPEIRLSVWAGRKVAEILSAGQFDAIHVATEGPLGLATRRWCQRHERPFTTSYHTRFPEYVRLRAPIPLTASYAWLRRFHGAASRTLVRTATQRDEMKQLGFSNLAIWPGGVDTRLFRPYEKDYLNFPRPISLYLGRVAPEKNIEAFLKLGIPGTKVVVGDGPSRAELEKRYPETKFLGYRHGEELARTLSAADVFVFPSRTDTLGLVMLEAMACGVPVAAFPVAGPQDVVIDGATGSLDEDLTQAVFKALALDPEACIDYANDFTWRRCTERFVQFLTPAEPVLEPSTQQAQR